MAPQTPPAKSEDIVLALQFWEGDRSASLRLAKTIADVEPAFNTQALFLFVHAFDCEPPPAEVVDYVAKKFRTMVVKSTTPWTGYPDGCAALWLDCIDWARKAKRDGLTTAECMLTFEFDCSPLVTDWIDKLVGTFRRVSPKAVMGDHHPYTAAGLPKGFGHINGNMVVSLRSVEVLDQIATYRQRHKPRSPWDVVIYPDLYRIGAVSIPEIQSDYRAHNLRPSYLATLRRNGVLFHHGCKDTSVIDFVSGNVPKAPEFKPDSPIEGLIYLDDTRESVFAQAEGGLVEFDEPRFSPDGDVWAKHNGSLVSFDGREWLAYRRTVTPVGRAPEPPELWLADYTLGRTSNPRKLSSLARWGVTSGWVDGYADPRLFVASGRVHLAYSHYAVQKGVVVACNQRLCRLSPQGEVEKNIPLPYFNNHPKAGLFEKNWSFFEDRGRIFAVYSILPQHVVVDTATGRTVRSNSFGGAADWNQTYGQPRGSTPPIRLPNGNFFALFHSHKEEPLPTRRYFVGAYRFSGQSSNCQPVRFTRKPILSGSLRDGLPWDPNTSPESPAVVFPGSVSFSPDGSELLVVSGLNEHSVCWHRFEFDKILKELNWGR